MEIYRVSLIGHRYITNSTRLADRLSDIIKSMIREHDFVEFYIGRNGDFDILAASVIKQAQKELGMDNSTLSLVLPYRTADEEYYAEYYDDIIYPLDVNTHYKAAISKRNEWLSDNCDLLIAHVTRKIGGAHNTLKYAQSKNKNCLLLCP